MSVNSKEDGGRDAISEESRFQIELEFVQLLASPSYLQCKFYVSATFLYKYHTNS